MNKNRLLILILILILLIPVLKPYIQDKVIYWRIRNAIAFPKDGYITNSNISVNVYIEIDSKKSKLKTRVEITNNNNEELNFMIAAMKLKEEVSYYSEKKIQIVMYKPVDLSPTEQTYFEEDITLKSVSNQELEKLTELLSKAFIKIVYNDGIQLLEVKPEVINQ